MRHGFVKVAAATPDIRVADVEFNKENICRGIEEAEKANAKILVFPELCVTGYTCSDLFDHAVLLKAAKKALLEIAEFTRDRDLLVFVGVPLGGWKALQCGSSPESWKDPGTDDKDISSELRGIL